MTVTTLNIVSFPEKILMNILAEICNKNAFNYVLQNLVINLSFRLVYFAEPKHMD